MDTCTHTVMPASIELINYYFHQISSFCYFNVLCCINHWWHLPIAGDPVMTRSPTNTSYRRVYLPNLRFNFSADHFCQTLLIRDCSGKIAFYVKDAVELKLSNWSLYN